jgi:DNA-binding beta-propeller fold protein YncE
VRGGRAFIATTSASYDSISVLDMDTKTVLSVHPLAFNVTGIAVSPDGAQLFAARTGRLVSDVAVVDLATAQISSVPVVAECSWSLDVIRTDTSGQL